MNIEAYNLDSIRKLVRDLQAENRELKQLLDNAGISYAQSDVFEATPDKAPEYDIDQGARILPLNINRKTSPGQFYDMFKGRRDVYAQRSKKGGYFPQCVNRLDESISLAKEVRKVLDVNKSERHIRGGMATREKYLHQRG